jgi:glutamine amidotransferase
VSGLRVVVLDYEMSNLRSAVKALERLGARVGVARGPDEVSGADALVLPGVGHFGEAVRRLRAQGLDRAVRRAADEGVPVLGICLGFQLLFGESEESPGATGLGLLPGAARTLRTPRKVPHIGWAEVEWGEGAALAPPPGTPALDRTYYFVHSYACVPEEPSLVMGTAEHGVAFCAAAGEGHVMGAQFHPEKSSRPGLALLGRWLALVAARTAPAPTGASA